MREGAQKNHDLTEIRGRSIANEAEDWLSLKEPKCAEGILNI